MPVRSETVSVGSPAPDFALTALDGREIKLSHYRGRAVVLVFMRGLF